MRVALEKMGWKPKNPARATLEAHIKSGLGEVWEENEFWFDMCVNYIDPKGDLFLDDAKTKTVHSMWESKKTPGTPVTIAEWYDAGFSENLPNLKKTALADERYKNEEFPVYTYMRDHGAWTEEIDIYSPQERKVKFNDSGDLIVKGKKYAKDDLSKDESTGVIYAKDKKGDGKYKDDKKPVAIDIDGDIMEGFATLDKKLNFFSEWLADDWKWPEYAIPIYPRNEEEKKKMVHITSHVNHMYMDKAKNEYALNTVFRLPYNIHTRSANSKHLMEISQNHDPIWISTADAKRQAFKRGDPIRVRIVDSVKKDENGNDMESGYFVAMAIPTEGILPGTLACSHHGGRWKLVNSFDVPNGVTDGKVDSQPVTRNMNDPKFMDHAVENAGKEGGQVYGSDVIQ